MPTRIVREGINSSSRINALSFGAEVLYRRLLNVADDYGRFYAAPATLIGACWPTNPNRVRVSEVKSWLTELQAGPRPLISIYIIDGCEYLHLSDFGQKPRSKSKFPEPASNLQTTCEQSANNCSQVADNPQRNAGTIRMRNSNTYSDADADAKTNRNGRSGDRPVNPPVRSPDWPQTLEAVQRGLADPPELQWPTTDVGFVDLLIERCRARLPTFQFSDETLAEAVLEAARKSPKQKSQGLFLTSVPEVLEAWARQQQS
jgi:hypothetical protein